MLAAYAWFGYATLIAVSAICLASIFLDETETNTTTPNTDAP
jgi:hypothetical protein